MAKRVEMIDWSRLMPFLSIRIFELPGLDHAWTEDYYKQALELPGKVLSVIAQFPCRKNAPKSQKPRNITPLGSIFLELAEGLETAIEVDPDSTADMPRELTGQHFFVTAAWYRLQGLPPWLRSGPKMERGTSRVEDLRHHLVLLGLLPPYIGVNSTHEAMLSMLSAFLEEGELQGIRLSRPARPVRSKILETALVNGETYHLWLSGNHPSVVTRPDGKILTGKDLRHALDPFGDQTYSYSAAISRMARMMELDLPASRNREQEQKKQSVGYSRNKGTVWMSRTKGLQDFAQRMELLRRVMVGADERQTKAPTKPDALWSGRGLDFLSKPVPAAALGEVKDPFEIELLIGEPEVGGFGDRETSEATEEWRRHGYLELDDWEELTDATSPAGISLVYKVSAYFDDVWIASFELDIRQKVETQLSVETRALRPTRYNDPNLMARYNLLDSLIGARRGDAFSILYESGHRLNGSRLFKPEYQDVLFDGWRPIPLKVGRRRFEPSKEKPTHWMRLNKRPDKILSGDSLFARVVHDHAKLLGAEDREWHLLCHDQANEVADFIHIEPEHRRIVLIHVKGAQKRTNSKQEKEARKRAAARAEREGKPPPQRSASDHRKISVVAYETVVEQAIKNLRHFEVEILYQRLLESQKQSGGQAGAFYVSSEKPDEVNLDCKRFMAALERMREREKKAPVIDRKVIVFQPHVRSALWEEVETLFEGSNDRKNDPKLRLPLMLSSILIEAQVACLKRGMEFEVWSELSPKAKRGRQAE